MLKWVLVNCRNLGKKMNFDGGIEIGRDLVVE